MGCAPSNTNGVSRRPTITASNNNQSTSDDEKFNSLVPSAQREGTTVPAATTTVGNSVSPNPVGPTTPKGTQTTQGESVPNSLTQIPMVTTTTAMPLPAEPNEEELSDISQTSEDSDEDIAKDALISNKPNIGTDLSAEREQAAAPSIEEEYFEYDDVKISKNEAKSKQWRLAGRKGTIGAGAGHVGGPGGAALARAPAAGNKAHQSKFAFADFLVTVDEVDAVEALQATKMNNAAAGSPSLTSPTSGSPTTGIPGHILPETLAQRQARLLEESMKPTRRPNTDYAEVKKFAVTNLLGHASRVKCIAIAPGEREFVSCSNEDASVTLSNMQSGKEIGIFTGHQDTVINATFSSDGKYLATTSRDHTMILWDVVTAKQLLTFDHAKVVICCCFSRDSKYVATGCQDKVCRLWETRKGRECLIFAQHEGIIISMAYAPDNSHIVSASADKTLRVWSTTTAKCKFILNGHQGIVLSCHYSNDGKRIISNDEKLLKVWSAVDGSCTLTLVVDDVSSKLKHTPSATKKLTWTLSCAAPGEFTQYLLVACNNRFVYLLDIVTGEEVSSVFCKAPVYCLAAGYKHVVAFGDSFGNIYLIHMS